MKNHVIQQHIADDLLSILLCNLIYIMHYYYSESETAGAAVKTASCVDEPREYVVNGGAAVTAGVTAGHGPVSSVSSLVWDADQGEQSRVSVTSDISESGTTSHLTSHDHDNVAESEADVEHHQESLEDAESEGCEADSLLEGLSSTMNSYSNVDSQRG